MEGTPTAENRTTAPVREPLINTTGVPAELVEFLTRPTPRSLLIRGPPGTGKTLLTLALLDAFPGRRIYVTTRFRRAHLEQDFPILGRLVEGGQLSVIDATERDADVRAAVRALKTDRKLVTPEDSAPTLRALLLPPELLDAWSQAPATAPTIIALDSWDAIVDQYLGPSGRSDPSLPGREEIERLAVSQMAEGPVVLVMVCERQGFSQLDYLVGGIVSMDQQIHEDRIERWLRLEKLRGTRIVRSAYPFTLEGGRFEAIAPLRMDVPPGRFPIEPRPGPLPGQAWPGSADFADHFGTFRRGEITLLEVDPEVWFPVLHRMMPPMLTDAVSCGSRVLHIPSPGMQPLELWRVYERGGTSKEAFLRQVRVICPLLTDDPEGIGSVVLPLPTGPVVGYEPAVPEANRFLQENLDPNTPNLAVLSIWGMETLAARVPGAFTTASVGAMVLTYLHNCNVHALYVGPSESPLTRAILPMATRHVRLSARDGRVFARGIAPRTPSFVLSEGDERAPYHLRLVV